MVHERQWEAAVATVMWPTGSCFRTGRRVSDRGSGCGLTSSWEAERIGIVTTDVVGPAA
jgi:hypothetical protein